MPGAPRFYLNLGSNIDPALNLAEAVRLLRRHGEIVGLSGVWESQAVGSDGPNFLNAAVGFLSPETDVQLKQGIVAEIEAALGRVRTTDKYAPRTIDVDILLAGGRAMNLGMWASAFVIVPLAELLPELAHPLTGRRLADEAAVAMAASWIRRLPDVTL